MKLTPKDLNLKPDEVFQDRQYPETEAYKMVMFKDLKMGNTFVCDGDILLNYGYSKFCKCAKTRDDKAEEIDGISFYIEGTANVFIDFVSLD